MHISNNKIAYITHQFNCIMLHLELLLNRIYYSLHNINFFISHYVFGKPIVALFAWPLYCIPFARKHLKKKGMTFESWMKISNDTADYISGSYNIHFFMSHVLYSPFLFTAAILQILIGESFHALFFNNLLLFLIIISTVNYLICHRFVWKNDRYKKFFRDFKKEGVKKKVIWGLGTFLYCILYPVLLIFLFDIQK